MDRSTADLPVQDEISGNLGASKVIRVDQKRFFFDLGNNNRGHFLRISEVYYQLCFMVLIICSVSSSEPLELGT